MLIQPQRVFEGGILLQNFMKKNNSCETNNSSGTFGSEQSGEVIPGTWRIEGLPQGTLAKLKKVPRKPITIAKQIQK